MHISLVYQPNITYGNKSVTELPNHQWNNHRSYSKMSCLLQFGNDLMKN